MDSCCFPYHSVKVYRDIFDDPLSDSIFEYDHYLLTPSNGKSRDDYRSTSIQRSLDNLLEVRA